MEIKQHEQNQLNDFQAQYESLLGNVRVANSELSIVLIQKDKALLDLQEIESNISKGEQELSNILKEAEDKTNALKEGEDKLEKEIQVFTNLKGQKEAEFIDIEKDLVLKESIAKENLDSILSEIKANEDKNLELQSTISDKLLSLGEINTQLEDTNRQLQDNISNISDLKSKINELEDYYTKTSAANNDELANLLNQIEEEKQKLELPKINFEKELFEFELRKRNFDILLDRFKVHFMEMYPGQEIKI